MPHQMSAEVRNCIDNCLKCHSVCIETVNHCLNLGEEHANAQHIQTLLDCAQICQVNADFMLRLSDLHPNTSNVCEKACKRCAQDCKKISSSDSLMKQCIEICNACAKSCEKMTNH